MRAITILISVFALIILMCFYFSSNYKKISTNNDDRQVSILTQIGLDHLEVIMKVDNRGEKSAYYPILFYPARSDGSKVQLFYCKEHQLAWIVWVDENDENKILASYSISPQRIISSERGELKTYRAIGDVNDGARNDASMIPFDENCAKLLAESYVK